MPQFFSSDESALFFRLLLSYLLTDFFPLPTAWVTHKQRNRYRSKYLYGHSLIAGILTCVFAGRPLQDEWLGIWVVAFVGIMHGFIDYLKLTYGTQRPLRSFLAYQAAYILMLFLVWLWLTDNWNDISNLSRLALTDKRFMAVLSGYLICTTPVGFVIGIATSKWQRQLAGSSDTLVEAGKWIGIAERVLIFSFVLLNQYEAIGFLIAAKSLLRFREGKQAAKQSEYVLVGTLLSYSLAILIGLLIKLTIE